MKLFRGKWLYEFVRFCIVGVLCTILDYVIFCVVNKFAPYQVALVSGYLISLVVNYYLTILWTFKAKLSKRSFGGIVTVHLFNLFVIRMGLMLIFVEYVGIKEQLAYIPTLCISVPANFIIIKLLINTINGNRN